MKRITVGFLVLVILALTLLWALPAARAADDAAYDRVRIAHIRHMLCCVKSMKDVYEPLRMPRLDTALTPIVEKVLKTLMGRSW